MTLNNSRIPSQSRTYHQYFLAGLASSLAWASFYLLTSFYFQRCYHLRNFFIISVLKALAVYTFFGLPLYIIVSKRVKPTLLNCALIAATVTFVTAYPHINNPKYISLRIMHGLLYGCVFYFSLSKFYSSFVVNNFNKYITYSIVVVFLANTHLLLNIANEVGGGSKLLCLLIASQIAVIFAFIFSKSKLLVFISIVVGLLMSIFSIGLFWLSQISF